MQRINVCKEADPDMGLTKGISHNVEKICILRGEGRLREMWQQSFLWKVNVDNKRSGEDC